MALTPKEIKERFNAVNSGAKELSKIKKDRRFKCSKCGNIMVKRKSKFNKNHNWYGCSAFPICKFTVSNYK